MRPTTPRRPCCPSSPASAGRERTDRDSQSAGFADCDSNSACYGDRFVPELKPAVCSPGRWMTVAGILLGGAAFLSGCGMTSATPPKAPALPPPEVEVTHPTARNVIDYFEFPGQTAAVGEVEIRARVTGYIVKVNFEDGQEVKQGRRAVRDRSTSVPGGAGSGTGRVGPIAGHPREGRNGSRPHGAIAAVGSGERGRIRRAMWRNWQLPRRRSSRPRPACAMPN